VSWDILTPPCWAPRWLAETASKEHIVPTAAIRPRNPTIIWTSETLARENRMPKRIRYRDDDQDASDARIICTKPVRVKAVEVRP
jgi:hypothetical protein